MFIFRPEDFPLGVITSGLDEMNNLIARLRSIFEEIIVLMSSENYECLMIYLNRGENELTEGIQTITGQEQRLSSLVVDVFQTQRKRVETYFNSFPYRTRALNQEYTFAMEFLNAIHNDLKINVEERVSRNRISMQAILESVREQKRTWEIAIVRDRMEE